MTPSSQSVSELKRTYPVYVTVFLFCLIVGSALIGVPAFGIVYGYTWVDWTMFGFLYVITGLGITVGYHRLISHRSFMCPDWVKAGLLIAGGGRCNNPLCDGEPITSATMLPATKTPIPTTLD